MPNRENISIDIYNRVKVIYNNYFLKNYDEFFGTSVLFTNVYKITFKNKEVFDFLKIIKKYRKQLKINPAEHIMSKYGLLLKKLHESNIEAFAIFVILLESFEKKEFFFNGYDKYNINLNLNFIAELYSQKNYDIKSEEEFSKYNLIEIKEYRNMQWQELRIVDKKYNITLNVKKLNKSIYRKIFNLYTSHSMKLSIYPSSLGIKNYIDKKIMIFDEKEFGKKYNFDDMKKINIKDNIKFIDYAVENKLYVKLDQDELTFEEVQKSFNCFSDLDVLYTKVVHLIFFIENEKIYIKHIDLEYIFYTLEEYVERFENDNFKQKGSRYKRQKIFKIDNAKIDLIEHLYELVYFSLENKTLIDEYFTMLNDSSYIPPIIPDQR